MVNWLRPYFLSICVLALATVMGGLFLAAGLLGRESRVWNSLAAALLVLIPRARRQGFDYWKVLECTHSYSNSFYYADGPEKLKT